VATGGGGQLKTAILPLQKGHRIFVGIVLAMTMQLRNVRISLIILRGATEHGPQIKKSKGRPQPARDQLTEEVAVILAPEANLVERGLVGN